VAVGMSKMTIFWHLVGYFFRNQGAGYAVPWLHL